MSARRRARKKSPPLMWGEDRVMFPSHGEQAVRFGHAKDHPCCTPKGVKP